jgi:hypothetical protein
MRRNNSFSAEQMIVIVELMIETSDGTLTLKLDTWFPQLLMWFNMHLYFPSFIGNMPAVRGVRVTPRPIAEGNVSYEEWEVGPDYSYDELVGQVVAYVVPAASSLNDHHVSLSYRNVGQENVQIADTSGLWHAIMQLSDSRELRIVFEVNSRTLNSSANSTSRTRASVPSEEPLIESIGSWTLEERTKSSRYHTEGRGPQTCNKCGNPRKGHVCPFVSIAIHAVALFTIIKSHLAICTESPPRNSNYRAKSTRARICPRKRRNMYGEPGKQACCRLRPRRLAPTPSLLRIELAPGVEAIICALFVVIGRRVTFVFQTILTLTMTAREKLPTMMTSTWIW